MLSSHEFEKRLDALPAIAARNDWAGVNFISGLIDDVAGDSANTATIIDRGFGIVRALAESGSESGSDAANGGIFVLALAAAGDPACTAVFIEKGLDIAPAIPAQNGQVAQNLVDSLIYIAGLNDGRRIVCREFMRTECLGRESRPTLILFGTSPETTLATSGSFRGNLSDLKTAVEQTHPKGSSHRHDYENVLTAAFEALSHKDQLPSFADLAKARLRQAPAAA